ncbi:MAG: M55 family metallopeptidase [Elusimicrobia bacterium]|nr:M55 family metallopeptidase [Elusimicrobiota bacterium]
MKKARPRCTLEFVAAGSCAGYAVALVLVSFGAAGCMGAKNRTGGREPDSRGCAVIVTDDDITSGSSTAGALFVPAAEVGKELLTADVAATAQGFLDAGMPCVQVIDSHDGAINQVPLNALGISVLTPSQTRGWTWPYLGPMEPQPGLAALVGFHSSAGQKGFRPHTFHDGIKILRINGRDAGEVTHLMLGLGALNVPVVLVHGDMNATAEAASLEPRIATVTVRWLNSKGTAAFLNQKEATSTLRRAARGAMTSGVPPYRPALPVEVVLEARSKALLEDRSRSLVNAWRERLADEPLWDRPSLRDFDFAPVLSADGAGLRWQAPDSLTAFLSIAVATHHLQEVREPIGPTVP